MFKDKYLNRCKEPIKSHFIYVNFILWLQRNEGRFLVKPYIRRIYKESFAVGLNNVENISIHFDLSGFVTIPVFFKSECFDILTDFDISEEREGNKYFCGQCGSRRYFSSRDELWENHVYEPLLEWVNENIKSGNYLCIYDFEGSTTAKIVKSEDLFLDKNQDHLILKRPIL